MKSRIQHTLLALALLSIFNLMPRRNRVKAGQRLAKGACLIAFSLLSASTVFAQTTAITYQGRLNDGANPANGRYDFRFTVYDADTNGNIVTGPVTNAAVAVTNGLFTTLMDFGCGPVNSEVIWLDLAVRTNGSAGGFTSLAPRTLVTPVPLAYFANTASNLSGPLPSSQLAGTYGNPMTFNNGANSFSGTFYGEFLGLSFLGGSFSGAFIGDGSSLINLNATRLASGTVPDARLSTNVALLSANQLFLGTNTFAGVLVATNPANQVQGVFTGSFVGNGAGLTNLNASQLSGGIISLAQLPTVVITNDSANLTIGGTNAVAPLTVPPNVPVAAVGSVGTGNYPWSVAVAGRYAYVVSGASTLQIFDVSSPAAPVLVGSVGTGSNPFFVAVAGRYAYVVDRDSNTLQIFDVGNPSAPVLVGSVGTGSIPASVAVAGRYAYVVNWGGNTLQIFDVSNPSGPVSVGSVGTGSYPNSVAVAGRYAYVLNFQGDQGNTLQIFDVSNPAAPVSVGLAGANNHPYCVAVAGRYAYVVNAVGDNLQIFDVSNPSAPVSVSSAATGVWPQSIAVAGRYAYVVNADGTLQIFDVSSPAVPVSVGSVGTGSSPYCVAVAGRYAYVVSGGFGTGTLQIFDLGGAYIQQLEAGAMETGTLQTRDTVTVGNNLDVRGGLTVSASARISGGLSVDNGTITATNFVGNGSGLMGLNASQLTSGAVPSAVLTSVPAASLTGIVPLAQLPTGLITNDSANLTIGGTNVVAPLTVPPTVPAAAIGSVGTGNGPYSVTMAGRYAYVVSGNANTLQVFDVSTPSAPVNVGSVGTGSYPMSVAVAGRYAYVVNETASTLQIFDVSTPSAPASVGSVGTASVSASVAVAGRYVYVADFAANTLQIFDVSTPSAPVSVGSVGTGSGPKSVTVAGRYAYVANAGANTLQIFDVSSPSAPVSVGSVGTGSYPNSVAVVGRYAYVVNWQDSTLQIFDVSTPSAPVSVGSVGTDSNPNSVVVAGRYAYVVNGTANTLQILDVSIPSAPVSVGSVGTGMTPESVAVAGRYAYVVSFYGSTLQIFDLGGACIQQLEAGAMETGTLQTRDTVTVGNNLDVRGGLTVSASARISGGLSVDNGTIAGNGSGLTNTTTAANYVFAYDTTTQVIGALGTFQDVTFSANGQLNRWTHTAGTAAFTCGQSGLYLIEYTAEVYPFAGGNIGSLIAVLNGTEITGSQSSATAVANVATPLSKSFLVNVNSGDALKIQFTYTVGPGELITGSGSGTTKPSISCTIIRIQ